MRTITTTDPARTALIQAGEPKDEIAPWLTRTKWPLPHHSEPSADPTNAGASTRGSVGKIEQEHLVTRIYPEDQDDVKLAKGLLQRTFTELSGCSRLDLAKAITPTAGIVNQKAWRKKTLAGLKRNGTLVAKLNALVWLYELHGPGRVSVEWVCETLTLDVEHLRRVCARNLCTELALALFVIELTLGKSHARQCADRLSEYISVPGWTLH